MTLFIPCRSSFRRCCGDLPGTRCRRPSPRAFRHLFQLIARVKALFSLSLSLSLSLVPKVSPVESSDSALIGAIMDLFTERGVFSISILIKISIVPRIGNRATEKKERTIPFDLSNVWTTVNLILQIFGKCKGILKVSFFFFFLIACLRVRWQRSQGPPCTGSSDEHSRRSRRRQTNPHHRYRSNKLPKPRVHVSHRVSTTSCRQYLTYYVMQINL